MGTCVSDGHILSCSFKDKGVKYLLPKYWNTGSQIFVSVIHILVPVWSILLMYVRPLTMESLCLVQHFLWRLCRQEHFKSVCLLCCSLICLKRPWWTKHVLLAFMFRRKSWAILIAGLWPFMSSCKNFNVAFLNTCSSRQGEATT